MTFNNPGAYGPGEDADVSVYHRLAYGTMDVTWVDVEEEPQTLRSRF